MENDLITYSKERMIKMLKLKGTPDSIRASDNLVFVKGKDCYFTTTPFGCSCPIGSSVPMRCEHMNKHFSRGEYDSSPRPEHTSD